MTKKRTVEIVEVSPRDGLQNEATQVSTADKIALIERAIAAGSRRIEATSFVNPRRVPQMADAEAVMKGAPRISGVSYVGLALNERGFERAAAAGCHEVTYAIVATETFNRRNNSVPVAETLKGWRAVARAAKAQGLQSTAVIAASFGCPFEGEVASERVLNLAARVLEDNPDELAFADTIGCGVPTQVTTLLEGARALSPTVKLRCHFHDTRNTGIANCIAAVAAGVDALDSSIGGFGGCPFAPAATGNVATEDVVYALSRMNVATGLDATKLIDAAHWLSGVLAKKPASAVARAGWFPPDQEKVASTSRL